MQKNENNLNSSNITNESRESLQFKNIHILPQLEKDICILINYIRTNPLDFSNNFIKNSKNKNLTEDQIDLIKFLEEKYNKEQLLPFHEIPEISLAAKNLLYLISQNETISPNKTQKKLKASSLNLRTRLSNYGIRTGRIFSNVIFGIGKPEDIVNHILKGENGRNMLLSNKMKFIGIGCCLLPTNKVCVVIDIVQDFVPYKKSKKNGAKYNNINNLNNNKYNENTFSPKMKIIINKTNDDKKEYYSNITNNKPSNQRKKNILNENSNNNIDSINKNIYKTPDLIPTMDQKEKKSYKNYNIIINNNKIIPIRNNLSNINEIDENKIHDKELKFEVNSCKVGMNKSKSFYGFKFNSGNIRGNNINRYQKLNRKEKLEILHKINQRKNNNSLIKNRTNFENLIPLSPDYSENTNNINSHNKYLSPISTYYSKRIYNNFDSDSNNLEFNETMPNFLSPKLDNDFKLNEIKNDLIALKNQIKEELKLEVKKELKNEIKQENKDIKDSNKENQIRNVFNSNIIYHKRYKSDYFMKDKNGINSVKKNEINQNNNQSFINNNKNNLYIKEEYRIKNRNEIKKLIRLYNKEKDNKRIQTNSNKFNDTNINNKISNHNISNFFFSYNSSNNNQKNINTNINSKEVKYTNDKNNLFLMKYKKAIPKDQTFKLIKNKTSDKKSISKLCLKKDIEKQINNSINSNQIVKEKKTENDGYIINSYRSRSKASKKFKEQSLELYLNDQNNNFKENKRYRTPKKNLKLIIDNDNNKLNFDAKSISNNRNKTVSYKKPKICKL